MNAISKTATASVGLQAQSPWRRVAVEFTRSPSAMLGLVVLMIIILVAALAPWIVVQNPYDLMQLNVMDARMAPGSSNMDTGYTYWLALTGKGGIWFQRSFTACASVCGSGSVRH